MNEFESVTECFDSTLVANTMVVNLKQNALNILTTKSESGYYNLLESVDVSPDVLGYVQINDSESYDHRAIEELVEFIAQDTHWRAHSGRQYGYVYELITKRFRHSMGRMLLALMEFGKPTIAGMQGHITGEYLGITLAFDARIAAADTIFSFDNMRTGIPGAPGLTCLLPRYIGIGKAMSLIHGGATIDAQEAHSLGLVSEVVDNREQLTDRCINGIRNLTAQNHYLVRLHRQNILPSMDEVKAALERYYVGMSTAVLELRKKRDSEPMSGTDQGNG